MNQIELLIAEYIVDLQNDINDFIKDKELISVQIIPMTFKYMAVITYKI